MSDLNKLANLPEYPDGVNVGVPKPFTQHELIVKDEFGNVVDNANVSTFTTADGTVVEDLTNPTGQRTPTISAEVPCPKVVVPTADDLRQIFLAIGNRYGWQELEKIEEILGAFPLSFTWNPNFDFKELEWDGRIEALIEEFKMFPAVKIAEVLSEFVPFDFEFTDPIFGIKVDVIKLFKDPEYKGQLIQEMKDKFEELKDLLPDLSRENWDGTDGVDSPDLALTQMFKEMDLHG